MRPPSNLPVLQRPRIRPSQPGWDGGPAAWGLGTSSRLGALRLECCGVALLPEEHRARAPVVHGGGPCASCRWPSQETGLFCNRENMLCLDLAQSSHPLRHRVRPEAAKAQLQSPMVEPGEERFYFRFLGGPQNRLTWSLDPEHGQAARAIWRLRRCVVGLQMEHHEAPQGRPSKAVPGLPGALGAPLPLAPAAAELAAHAQGPGAAPGHAALRHAAHRQLQRPGHARLRGREARVTPHVGAPFMP